VPSSGSLQHAVAELPDGGAEQPPLPRRGVELHAPEELGGAVGQPLEPLHGGAGAGGLVPAAAAGERQERRDEAQDGVPLRAAAGSLEWATGEAAGRE